MTGQDQSKSRRYALVFRLIGCIILVIAVALAYQAGQQNQRANTPPAALQEKTSGLVPVDILLRLAKDKEWKVDCSSSSEAGEISGKLANNEIEVRCTARKL
ncbi:hypothetical protein AGMMS49545_03590 [Betaproteobacteria bacterium]|nr:hypothetical protein AGMMS49545_03590 [Betaproteobacteria bacterium]GHU41702.1 hypothetical protein AGMMS50289_05270 [Betaproteobacteria bacterium]